jgi:hypothetical protein
MWIINLTADPHILHMHLVNMIVVKRYKFDYASYKADFLALNGKVPFANNKQTYLN